jgi:hypothetical protein
MPQFSIPDGRADGSPRMLTFLSPRKSFVAVVIVCALSAAALWTGRTPSQAPAVGANDATQLRTSADAIL